MFGQSYPLQKESRLDPKHKETSYGILFQGSFFIFIQLIQSLDPFYEGN